MTKKKAIIVDGIKYIPESEATKKMASNKGLKYVICRTYSAGVFAGYLKERKGQEVELLYARRLWKWSGAARLSQLAMEGVSDPSNCKFPCEVDSVELLQAIEIIPCTQKAKDNIDGVVIWSA